MNTLKCLALGFLIVVVWFGYARISADIHIYNAMYFSKKGDLQNAILSANRAYKINPGDKTPLAMSGTGLLRIGKITDGIVFLEEYVKFNPYGVIPLINLAIGYQLSGQIQDANRIKRRVAAISPKHLKYTEFKKK